MVCEDYSFLQGTSAPSRNKIIGNDLQVTYTISQETIHLLKIQNPLITPLFSTKLIDNLGRV